MSSEIVAAISGLIGTVVGGVVTYSVQLKLAREQNKTDFMAERTVQHFLTHKGYAWRSFAMLKERLGGFGEDELRKILVRAGAIRRMRSNNKNKPEWWRLLNRVPADMQREKK